MQNASGLWGKVKSQAQQAGSMAQGAMNVCWTPFVECEGAKLMSSEWWPESYNRWTRIDAVFYTTRGIAEGSQDLTALLGSVFPMYHKDQY